MAGLIVIPPALIQASSIVSGSVSVVIFLLGGYAVLECIRALIATERSPQRYLKWWPLLSVGIADVAVGVCIVLWLDAPVLQLLYLTSGWAVLAGIITIVAAIRRRKSIMGEWLLGLGGATTMVLAGYLLLYPLPGLITIGWFISSYLIAFSALAVIFIVERRRLKA